MDFFHSLSLFILVIIFCILPFLLSKKFKKSSSNLKEKVVLPPGDAGWPIVGETLQFISRTSGPERFIKDRMRKHSPKIFKTSLAGESMAIFCGPEGNKFLFSNENEAVESWWPRSVERITMSSASSVENTKKTRKVVPEFLRPDALQRYTPIMDSLVQEHLKTKWCLPSGVVKVFPLSKKLTFYVTSRVFMSLKDPEKVATLESNLCLVEAGLLSMPINFPGSAFNRGIKAANRIRDELSPIIRQRRVQLAEKRQEEAIHDLMSHIILSTNVEGVFLSEHEIVDMILGVLVAGHETTSTVITFVLYYLADYPHIYAQVLREQMDIAISKGPDCLLTWEDCQRMKYTRNVINEAMRLKPPSIGGFKQTVKDITYAGFTVPKGWKVYWGVHTTFKDSKYFPDPEKFDPCRFEGNGTAPFTFTPFGGGPRMCPGSEFARLQVLIFVHRFVTKFRWVKLIPNEKIMYRPTPIPVHGFPVRLFSHEK